MVLAHDALAMLAHDATSMLAHQGGWDELLFVGTPVIVFAFLLWLARARAERELDDEAAAEDDAEVRGER